MTKQIQRPGRQLEHHFDQLYLPAARWFIGWACMARAVIPSGSGISDGKVGVDIQNIRYRICLNINMDIRIRILI